MFSLSMQLYAQREAANWFFGKFAGLDFNYGLPVVIHGSQLDSAEGCSTISDKSGKLLFYTDGITVWNQIHEVMQNGNDLLGHHSSTQSAMIIPKPGSRSIYYIFTVDKPSYFTTKGEPIDGINFTEVDMNLDSGLGGVVLTNKNQHLETYDPNNAEQSEYKSSEKITAIQHGDGSSFWIITHFVNKFYAFKIDGNGVDRIPLISTFTQKVNPAIDEYGVNKSAIGYLKISPNGEKLAIAHSSTVISNTKAGARMNGKLNIYDFNPFTGIVTNEKTIITNEYPYGVEFSPKSNKLYVTANVFDSNDELKSSNLYQFDMTASNIQASKKTINNSFNGAGALQLAIDGKIYRAGYPRDGLTTKLSAINKPNENSSNCDYRHDKIETEETVTLGLPPFIQSYFLFTFDFEFLCYGDNTHFYITSDEPYDSVLWEFGDGNSSTDDDTYYTYVVAGDYDVKLTKYIGGNIVDEVTKTVTIFNTPSISSTPYDFVQCDAQDNNSHDGLSTFNLELANRFVSLESIYDIDVFYYKDQISAENDIENRNALEYIYSNTKPNEVLFAKILMKGSDCYSVSSIRLIAKPPIDLSIPDIYNCDFGDGTAEFNLGNQRQFVITSLGLPTNSVISFHSRNIDAVYSEYQLPDLYISKETKIYIRGDADGVCLGIGTLNLKVHKFPPIIEYKEIENCFNNFPLKINSGIPRNDLSNFSFDWGNGINSPEFEIQNAGEYYLTITNNSTLCTKTKTIKVIEILEPHIVDVIVDEVRLGHNIKIKMGREDDYLYALDNISGPYQNFNTFTQVLPGNHVIYVKNNYNCTIVERNLFILGYPKFFTPNNDNINDNWQIVDYDRTIFTASNISIFDRFGKLITVINPSSEGWNGLYNGEILPASGYWFSVEITDLDGNINLTRGNFSLIRR